MICCIHEPLLSLYFSGFFNILKRLLQIFLYRNVSLVPYSSWWFFSNSEVNDSELRGNLEEMFHRYYMDSYQQVLQSHTNSIKIGWCNTYKIYTEHQASFTVLKGLKSLFCSVRMRLFETNEIDIIILKILTELSLE